MAVLRARRGCKVADPDELNGSDIGDVGGTTGKKCGQDHDSIMD